MPPEQVVIVWQFSPKFNINLVAEIMGKYNASKKQPTNPYIIESWKAGSLTINLFAKKLVVQGKLDEYAREIIQEIAGLEGLILDAKNQERLAKIFPHRQNAIVCARCRTPSLLIEAKIEGLDVIFKNECGHIAEIRPPFLTLNNRILPDINVLVSRVFSRFIQLGYFLGFEIVIPQYILRVVDRFLGKGQKKAVSEELNALRQFANDNKVSILNYKDGFELPVSREQFEIEEDDKILEIAHLTNSVMITCDRNFKDKALLANRPTIYIPADILEKIKIIEEIRTPD